MIDNLIHQQSQPGHMKKCFACQTSNIDNKKRVCPSCNAKLLSIAEISQQYNESFKIIDAIEKPFVIHPYTFKKSNDQDLALNVIQ